MSNDKLRRLIAWEAARLVFGRQETEIERAKFLAARRIVRGRIRPNFLPHDSDVRAQIKLLALGHAEPTVGTLFEPPADPFELYESLLWPLEHVQLQRKEHPEGDALYHSLQVFELGKAELPYDEEFLLAALLHEVGFAIDPMEHVDAALAALEGTITDRTAWLIRHHGEAHQILEGTLGTRAARRLRQAENFEELMLLAKCDRAGRQPGAQVMELNEALDYLRALDQAWDEY